MVHAHFDYRVPVLWLAAGGRGTRSSTLHDFPYQFGFWWIRRFPRAIHLKCLTALVTASCTIR